MAEKWVVNWELSTPIGTLLYTSVTTKCRLLLCIAFSACFLAYFSPENSVQNLLYRTDPCLNVKGAADMIPKSAKSSSPKRVYTRECVCYFIYLFIHFHPL